MTSPTSTQPDAFERSDESDAQEYFATYAEHSKTLRLWFVAYGVGVPALIASSSTLSTRLFCTGYAGIVALMFLAGASIQVLVTLFNKHIMWAMYFGAANREFRTDWLYLQADRYADKYWIDVVADLLTVVIFAVASWLALLAAIDNGCLSAIPAPVRAA